jgi:transcription elongation factor Elf1
MQKECPKCQTINSESYTLDMYPPIYCFICSNCKEKYSHKNSLKEEDALMGITRYD